MSGSNSGVVVIFIIVMVVLFIINRVRNEEIKSNGISTEAFVSSIEDHDSVRTDGSIDREKRYVVRFKDQSGNTVTSTLRNPRGKLVIGSRIRISYMPGKTKTVLMTEKIE